MKKGWLPDVKVDDILKEIKSFGGERGQDVLIILNYPLDDQKVEEYSLAKVSEFVSAIVGYEQYYLYLDKEVYNAKD